MKRFKIKYKDEDGEYWLIQGSATSLLPVETPLPSGYLFVSVVSTSAKDALDYLKVSPCHWEAIEEITPEWRISNVMPVVK